MLGNNPLKPRPKPMVISAMLNLLAHSGIVPSWSSASALVGEAHTHCPYPSYLRIYDSSCT
eukprot:5371193-Amphidinium_carterae.1